MCKTLVKVRKLHVHSTCVCVKVVREHDRLCMFGEESFGKQNASIHVCPIHVVFALCVKVYTKMVTLESDYNAYTMYGL